MSILQYRGKLVFFLVLYAAIITIYIHFPSETGYFYQADEGTYYRQALAVNQQGISAFTNLTEAFKKNEHQEQLFPNPLRVGHILIAATVVYFNSSIRSLSFLSLFFFALLCFSVFMYLRKWVDEKTATIAACLVCVSPLLCGLSARALSDLDSCFFHTLTLLSFLHYIRAPDSKKFSIFIAVFALNILVKETGAFFIPFYSLILLYIVYYKKDKLVTKKHILGSLILPGLFSGLVVLVVLGWPAIFSIIEVVVQNNVSKGTLIPYVVNYNSGPWYLYIIDYLVLSPLSALPFLFFTGHYLLSDKKQFFISVLILYLAYFMACYNFLPKNVRYALPLDLIIRICSVMYLVRVVNTLVLSAMAKKGILYVVVLMMLIYDSFNYYKFFVTDKIYDPVSYELLRSEHIIPR